VPALGVSADVAKGVIRGWTSTKHKHYRQFVCGQRQALAYFTRSSAWRSGKQLNLSRKQLRLMMSFVGYKAVSLQAWTLGPREVELPRNSRQSTYEGGNVVGKVVGPKHPPLFFPQEIGLVLISVSSWVDHRVIVRPEGLSQWKIQMKPSAIKLATFWPVEQFLKNLGHCVSLIYGQVYLNWGW
jgi:hypothetical protein